jgi:hypothetical protein
VNYANVALSAHESEPTKIDYYYIFQIVRKILETGFNFADRSLLSHINHEI